MKAYTWALWRTGLLLAVLSVINATLACDAASAQNRSRGNRGSGSGFFAIGGSVLDIRDLNRRLEVSGFPTFDRTVLTIGGGGYGVTGGNLMLGGEGYGQIAGDEVHEGRTVSLHGGYGLFNVGYMLEPTRRTRAYPMLGIGGGGIELRIGPRPAETSFDDVLENPDRSSNLSRASFLFSVGGGFEYRPSMRRHGVILGIRGGYLFDHSTESWELDDYGVSSGPDASQAGPYLRFTIGAGGR